MPVSGVSCLWIYGSAKRDRWACGAGTAAISLGPISKHTVPVLRSPEGPNQRTVLGRRWIPAGIQTAGERELPVAEGRERGEGNHGTAVPVAHGGAEYGAAESTPSGDRTEHHINWVKALKILYFCCLIWYN